MQIMTKKREITIYDLAEKLNYSPSTISRALNNHKSISKKTSQLIQNTAREMGYRPNVLAAGLRNNKSKTIGVLIPTIAQPFLSSLISGVEIAAKKAGYNVVIMQTHDSYKEEVNLIQSMYDSRVSGVICSLALETKDTSHFQVFMDRKIPLVFVDRVPKNAFAFRVIIDDYAAGYMATKHLISQGCTRIAHLTTGSGFSVFNERKKGYIDALKEHNLPVDDSLVYKVNKVSYEIGEKESKKILNKKNPPDGIFAAVDILGIGALKCAKKMGLKIPEDLAIIGFDDDPISAIIDPSLSTISHPATKMGEISANRILEYSDNTHDEITSEVTILNTEVIVRESTNRNKLPS